VRAIDLQLVSRCDFVPCGPFRVKPFRGELWSGPPTGPFRRIAGGNGRAIVLDADLDRAALVYSESVPEGSSRVVLLPQRERPTVLAASRDIVFSRVSLAGGYAAWLERQPLERWPAPSRTVVVYDLAARQVAYTLGPKALGNAVLTSFDLQSDGTVALAINPSPVGGCDGGVAWASAAEPRPHFLVGNAIPWRIKTAAGRIAFITRTCGAPTPFRLVVETSEGRIVSNRTVAYGGFDFDGRRVAYLDSPKQIAVARVR
jgi:hypothetical protein